MVGTVGVYQMIAHMKVILRRNKGGSICICLQGSHTLKDYDVIVLISEGTNASEKDHRLIVKINIYPVCYFNRNIVI